jgi:hypothetical protein
MRIVSSHINETLGDTVVTSTHRYEDNSNAVFIYIEPCHLKVSTFESGFSFWMKSGDDRINIHFIDTEITELLTAIGNNIAELQDRLAKED